MVTRAIVSSASALVVGILFAMGGFLLPSFISGIVREKVAEKKILGLDNGGEYNEVLQKFVNPPFPMKMNVWVYNITNAIALMEGREKVADLDELGPYTFNVMMRKDVRMNSDETRLFYRTIRTYTYEGCAANCSLADSVVIASPSYQGVVNKAASNVFKRLFFNGYKRLVGWEKLESEYRVINVSDLLFDGYVDKNIEKLCKTVSCPGRPDRIGLFYGRNNTNEDGEYEVDTGKVDVANIGHVYSWNALNGSLNESYWFGRQARMINGTDSQLYPPFKLLSRENFQMFVGQACRSLEMEFDGYSVVDGVPALRYSPARSMQLDDRQKGFCGDRQDQKFFDDQSGSCPPRGLMEMDGCNPQATRVYLSDGHFHGADPRLRDSLVGFPEPDREKDVTYLDLEPHIGLVVQAESCSLISVGIKNAELENAMPLVMVKNYAHFDGSTRDLVAKALHVLYVASILHLFCYTLSFTFFAIGVLLILRLYCQRRIMAGFGARRVYFTAMNSVTATISESSNHQV